jgi:hypothetical protein
MENRVDILGVVKAVGIAMIEAHGNGGASTRTVTLADARGMSLF